MAANTLPRLHDRAARLVTVRDAQQALLHAEHNRKRAVREARADGASWAAIGLALGITPWAAHKLAVSGTARRKGRA